MAFDFSLFNKNPQATPETILDEKFIDWLVHEQSLDMILHYEKLRGYYYNPVTHPQIKTSDQVASNCDRPYRQAQEYGLPPRITGISHTFYGGINAPGQSCNATRKEVVIENDIAWRIDTIVDFLFGKNFAITSRCRDPKRAEEIQQILQTVFDANGGATYFQSLALLGSIYGFVDVILRWDALADRVGYSDIPAINRDTKAGSAPAELKTFERVLALARKITLEAIEAPRSLPVLNSDNYLKIDYYIQHFWRQHNQLEEAPGFIQTITHRGRQTSHQKQTHDIEIIGPSHWQRYEDKQLIAQGENPLGVVPVVHIQNMPVPMRYEGQSDVEPLIPLQDELNTRLSDRANRITFQSFKMYLGKGIDGFIERPVSPGQMWSTDNPDANIEEFGGDSACPSEDTHIEHIREALEKASGVASVAAGILKGRVGNLTSAVALKVTLMGVLAKTERKRQCYGKGIADMSRLILLALDKTGIYPNTEDERQIAIRWPNPLPENMIEKLQESQIKKELGVPQEQILKDLGY